MARTTATADKVKEQTTTPDIVVPGANLTAPPTEEGAKWEFLTPEMAQQYLAHNKVNRDLRQGDVTAYVRQMQNGTWTVCVEPLAFDTNENLINGQHRLTAQVQAGIDLWWLVLRGVPPETAKTVNGGAKARLSDILKYNGEKNYVILAGITNNTYLWAYDLLGAGAKVAPYEGEEWLKDHPDLRHSTELATHVAATSVIDIGPTALGAAHWIIAQANGNAEADYFLMRMAHLQNERPGSPILALLNRMNKSVNREGRKPAMRDQIAALIKVWNFDVEERFTRRIIIGTRGEWVNPEPLSKDNPMTEEELAELTEVRLPAISDVVPSNPEDIVDEGEEV